MDDVLNKATRATNAETERDRLRRYLQNVLQINDLNNLPALPHGENLNSLLNRPTQEQLQRETDELEDQLRIVNETLKTYGILTSGNISFFNLNIGNTTEEKERHIRLIKEEIRKKESINYSYIVLTGNGTIDLSDIELEHTNHFQILNISGAPIVKVNSSAYERIRFLANFQSSKAFQLTRNDQCSLLGSDILTLNHLVVEEGGRNN